MRITVTTMPTARFKSHWMRHCSIPTAPQPLSPAWTVRGYAIVPISIQVLYPANGGSADITLPDNVELLEYSFTSGDLCAATEEERQRQLHYDFSEVTASVTGIYVKATENFSVTLTYTDSEKSLTKALHVTLDDSAPFPGILQDRFAQEAQPATCSADAGVAAYAGLQVTQCVYTSVGWMNYLGGQPALCADSGKWAWGPGATLRQQVSAGSQLFLGRQCLGIGRVLW